MIQRERLPMLERGTFIYTKHNCFLVLVTLYKSDFFSFHAKDYYLIESLISISFINHICCTIFLMVSPIHMFNIFKIHKYKGTMMTTSISSEAL